MTLGMAKRPKSYAYDTLDAFSLGMIAVAALRAVNNAEDWRASFWGFLAVFAIFLALRVGRSKLEKKRISAALPLFLFAVGLFFLVPWTALGLGPSLTWIGWLCAGAALLSVAIGFLAGWGFILKRRI